MHHQDYISVAEAATILGLTSRQTRRYKTNVRNTSVGKKLYLHRGDITALAAQRQREAQARSKEQTIHRKQRQSGQKEEGELLAYLRERETHWEVLTERLQQQLLQAAHRIGELEATLSQRLLPHDASSLQQQWRTMQQERDQLAIERASLQQQFDNLHTQYATLQQAVTRLKKPWWKRLWRTSDRTV